MGCYSRLIGSVQSHLFFHNFDELSLQLSGNKGMGKRPQVLDMVKLVVVEVNWVVMKKLCLLPTFSQSFVFHIWILYKN